jgi:hypothetical protein
MVSGFKGLRVPDFKQHFEITPTLRPLNPETIQHHFITTLPPWPIITLTNRFINTPASSTPAL